MAEALRRLKAYIKTFQFLLEKQMLQYGCSDCIRTDVNAGRGAARGWPVGAPLCALI